MTKGLSPTQRTLRALRDEGIPCDTTEHFHGYAQVRKDLFGFVDIVALDRKRGIIAIQATTGANLSTRVKKILNECAEVAVEWLMSRGCIEVWGWRDLTHRVDGEKRKMTLPRIREITLEDFGI